MRITIPTGVRIGKLQMSPATTQYQDAAMMINCALIPVLVVWESIICLDALSTCMRTNEE